MPPVRALTRCLLLCLLFASNITSAGEVTGQVVRIHDGDTLTVLVPRQQITLRLVDIDAPERNQAFGTRSKQSLGEICAGKAVRVLGQGKDRYGRTLARVYCAGIDAQAEQVRRGMAWVFEQYAPEDSPLYIVQSEARVARRGLWQDARPVPPWKWRRTRSK